MMKNDADFPPTSYIEIKINMFCIQLRNRLISEVNLVRNDVYIVILYSVTQSAFI